MLDRSAILDVTDTPLVYVEVPEWSGAVNVPVVSLAELDDLAKAQKSADNSNALMAVRIIRDDAGDRIFTDDDAPVLAKKSSKALFRILKRFNEVNGLTGSAQDDAAKN